jgi:hypothetical protein
MRSCGARKLLSVGVVMLVLVLRGSGIGNAQPRPDTSAPANAETRAAAKKLVQEGISAQDAKDYRRAIALYLKAFSLDPHPLLLFNLGQAHRLAGCPGRAAPFYERYLALEPNGPQSAVARTHLSEIRRASTPDGADCAKAAAAEGLAEALPGAGGPPARLKLHSAPEGVTVMLDGVKIGTTPLERELAAGAHTIVLVDDGMLVGERKVELAAGEAVEVTMTVESPDRRSGAKHPNRIAPVLLWVAGGGALIGSGIAFYLGQKGGPDDKYVYPGMTAAGFALAGAGAAAIGLGIGLWVRGSRESSPVAAIRPDGGYLGWQGRF